MGFLRMSGLLCVAFALAGCSSTPINGDEHVASTAQRLVVPSVTVSLAFPPEVLSNSLVTARTDIAVQDRATLVDGSSGYASAVNLGTGQAMLGASAKLGSLWSIGPVQLNSSSTAFGNVTSASSITLQAGARILGKSTQHAALAPPAEALFGVVFPPFTSGDLTVPNDSFVTGSPNRYGNVIVRARSTLTIPAGSYYFDSLLVEPQATLVADDSLGPVFVYVRSALTLRGTVRGLESTVPELLLADFGSGSIELSGPFQGTLIARDALLNFSSQQVHSGAFYANHVTVGPDTKLTLAPFLKTRFTDAGGTPIGQCSNRASNAGTHRTVCLGARTDGTATLEMYVDGVLTPSTTGDCVDAVVKEPSTEVRAFELNQGGAVLHSDLVLLTTPAHADRCPLYSKMILGTRDDDILTGTSEAEYISGGPGNDLISGNGGEDVLVGGAGSDVFAFLDQIPVKIGVAWLVNDSSDKVQLDFTPGNMSGLFPRTTAPVSPSSVALAHRRFQSLGFGATASDFTAALGAPVTPNSLQALSIRPAATQAPIQVQFSSVTGSVVNGVTEYNTSSPSSGVLRYVLAVQQTVTPANTALKCGGTLGS
ncbi:MAG TPA: hypothetical protein VGM44_13745, partial [Polyangiaceae bacterium]